MLNNRQILDLFIKVSALTFAMIFVIFVIKSISGAIKTTQTAPEQQLAKQRPDDIKAADLTWLKSDKAANNTSLQTVIKPEFGKLPSELFPAGQAFSTEFHKLPEDFLTSSSHLPVQSGIAQILHERKSEKESHEIASDFFHQNNAPEGDKQ